jgi:hypothetical protein
MERAHVRTRQLPPLQRGFECSRLEGQLIAAAYELAVPIHRQPLPTPQHSPVADTCPDPSPLTTGGFSA